MMKKSNMIIYIIIVGVILFTPMILLKFFVSRNNQDIIHYDNRNPVYFEEIMRSEDKVAIFESWLSDHLPFRRKLITLWSSLNYKIGVSSQQRKVVVGRNGWLFLGNDIENTLDYYRKTTSYNDTEINLDLDKIVAIHNSLNEKDIDFLFVIAPNKSSIYPEYLPAWVTQDQNESYISCLLDIAKKSGVSEMILDLTPVLYKQKEFDGDDLYTKFDTHWSKLGAYYGYSSIMDELSYLMPSDFEKVKLLGYERSIIKESDLQNMLAIWGDKSNYSTELDLNHDIEKEPEYLNEMENWNGFILYKNDQALNKQTVLLIRDSFMNHQISLFYNSFNEVYSLHYSNLVPQTDGGLELFQLVDEYQPDIVIFEMAERRLPIFLRMILAD